MKMKKTIALTLAAVMSMAALPVLSASAEGAYALGDVDMDGIITGHDTAMVSRHLFDDSYTLTDEELALADVNQDGAVDQADNEWIHENEVRAIGEIEEDCCATMQQAYIALMISSIKSAGLEFNVNDSEPMYSYGYNVASRTINTVTYNLMDANADGAVTLEDAFALLIASSRLSAGYDDKYYFAEGRYDLFPDGYVVTPYEKPDGGTGYGVC